MSAPPPVLWLALWLVACGPTSDVSLTLTDGDAYDFEPSQPFTCIVEPAGTPDFYLQVHTGASDDEGLTMTFAPEINFTLGTNYQIDFGVSPEYTEFFGLLAGDVTLDTPCGEQTGSEPLNLAPVSGSVEITGYEDELFAKRVEFTFDVGLSCRYGPSDDPPPDGNLLGEDWWIPTATVSGEWEGRCAIGWPDGSGSGDSDSETYYTYTYY